LCQSEGHNAAGCADATTGVRALIDAGARLAGSQTALSKIVGISIWGLSRCKARDDLDVDFRRVLVSYLRDPKSPLPPVNRGSGARPYDAAEIQMPYPRVAADPDVLRDFLKMGDRHVRGRIGALGDALNEFMTAYARRRLPPPPDRLPPAHHNVRVDQDVLKRFQDFVGGPGFRNRYITLAITEYVQRRAKSPAGGAQR
jgi:hypothetical protein